MKYTKLELLGALERSLNLQSHYAKLLNMHDGGVRIGFENVDAWMSRLKEVDSMRTATTVKKISKNKV